jgi:glycosyltransferase involved in cell wall biosynthesis
MEASGRGGVTEKTVKPNSLLLMVGFAPEGFTPHSGLWPVARELGAEILPFEPTWSRLKQRSWTLGSALRKWGIRHYGSYWNALVPWRDEARILRALPKSPEPYPVHFIWGEFAAPKSVKPYHRKGARVVVSVHCSARRWDSVWLRPDGYAQADEVVLTSESQRPFVARHVPAERIRRIFLGVDGDHFQPPATRPAERGKLRLLLLGNTERDHEFAAHVAAKLPADRFEWRVRTDSHEQAVYRDVACVNLLPRLSDEEFLREYQQADVLAMPMLDSAANDVLLESIACGTPVMVNRVGGTPEYVDPACNFVMSNDRNVDEWVEKLLWLEKNRDVAERMRPATRAWAERFDWKIIAEDYRAMYRDVLSREQ